MQTCTFDVHFLESVFLRPYSEIFLINKIRRLSGNRPSFRVTQYDSLISHLYEIGHWASSALFETHPIFPEKPLCWATINRWFKKLKDALSKSLQRRVGLSVVIELVEIVGQSLYCRSRYLAKFLKCSKNTVLRRLTETSCKKKWSTWIPFNLSSSKGCKLQNICMAVSTAVHLSN